MVFADSETGSEIESSDDDSEISDCPTEEEETYNKQPREEEETYRYYKQPRTWSEAYGQMQKLVLSEKFKSLAAAKVRVGKTCRTGHGAVI